MNQQRLPAIVPGRSRDLPTGHPLHWTNYLNMREHHQPSTVDDGRSWVKGHHNERCPTRRVSWPCEVGLALAIIEHLLIDA